MDRDDEAAVLRRLLAAADIETNPFARPGLGRRAAPFVATTVIAFASIVLPTGDVTSYPRLLVGAALLVAGAALAAFAPWARMPSGTTVVVPLLLLAGLVAMTMAADTVSGVGLVVLMPLLWSALFHRPWESACLLGATVAGEVVLAVVQSLPGDDLARRAAIWGAVGAMMALSIHRLRDRLRHAREEAERVHERLHDLVILEDRERIATELRDKVMRKIFSSSMSLHGAASLSSEPAVKERVLEGVGELDGAIKLLAVSVFDTSDLDRRPQLAQEMQIDQGMQSDQEMQIDAVETQPGPGR